MEQNNNYSNISSFDSSRILVMMLKKKWLIITTVLLATIASIVISLMLPVWYKSSVNVVPPKNSDESGGINAGLSAVMKNVGLTKLGSKGEDSYTYTVILTSRTVTDSIIELFKLDKVYNMPKTKMTELRSYFLENIEIGYEKEGNYVISVWDENPNRAAKIANEYIKIANTVALRLARDEAQLRIEHISQRMQALDESINTINKKLGRFSKEYMMFAPEEQAKAVATALSEVKLQKLKYEMAYDLYRIEYGESDPMTQQMKRLASTADEKLKQTESEPGFAGNFAINQSASVGVEFIRMYSELEALTKMKALLIPALEDAKLEEIKNVKYLYVLDEAIPADKKDRPKRSLIVGGTFIGSFFLIIFILLIADAISETKKKLQIIKNDK